jgi:hypothetical protein
LRFHIRLLAASKQRAHRDEDWKPDEGHQIAASAAVNKIFVIVLISQSPFQ